MRTVRLTAAFTRGSALAFIAATMFLAPLTSLRAEEDGSAKITYDDHVKEIFRAKCFNCHNTDKKSGGLDLTSYVSLMQGGGSGAVIERGDASLSYLYMLVTHESEPNMPPNSEKLPSGMLATIEKWINGGALENKGSTLAVKKKSFDFSLSSAPSGRSEGPPPMPGVLSLEPLVRTERPAAVKALATSPWAPLAAVAGETQILLYNTKTLRLAGVLPFPEGVPHVLKFSRSGSLLLAAGGRGAYQGRAVVFDVQTGERVAEVGDEVDAVLAADISADQTRIALGGPSKVVRIYSTKDGKLLHELKKHTEWIYSIAFSPDGVLLATADRNGGLFVWEAYTAREFHSLQGHSQAITDLSWRADSNVLASASEDGSIRLWEMQNGNQIKSWGAHGGGAASVEFTRDGRLVSCGRDKVTKLWDQNGRQQRAFPAFADLALEVTHCDQTNTVFAGDFTGAIRAWKADDGAQLGELTSNPPTLQARLEEAAKAAAAKKAERDKLAAAYQAAQNAAAKIQADLTAANKQLADSQKLAQTAEATIKQTAELIAKTNGELEQAKKAVAAHEPVVALLIEAVAKAQAASGKAADDKELAAAVAALKAQLDQRSAALDAARKAVTDKTAAIAEANKQLDAAKTQAVDAAAAIKTAQEKIGQLTPMLKPAQDKAAEAKKALDAAEAALKESQSAVTRWQNAVEAEKKLKLLAERRSEYDKLDAAARQVQAELRQAQQQLAAAREEHKKTAEQSVSATAAVTQAEKAVADASTAHADTAKQAAALEAVLPMLTEALTKAQAAAAKLSGDKEIAAAVGQVKAVVDKKSAELEAARKTLAARTEALKQAKAQLASAQKGAADAQTALAAAQKRVTDLETAAKPLEKKAAEAVAAAEAARKELDQLRASLDALASR